MRALLILILGLATSGCLYAKAHSETVLTHERVNPDGTVSRETTTVASEGTRYGGEIPAAVLTGNGGNGVNGNVYGYGNGGYNGCNPQIQDCVVTENFLIMQPQVQPAIGFAPTATTQAAPANAGNADLAAKVEKLTRVVKTQGQVLRRQLAESCAETPDDPDCQDAKTTHDRKHAKEAK